MSDLYPWEARRPRGPVEPVFVEPEAVVVEPEPEYVPEPEAVEPEPEPTVEDVVEEVVEEEELPPTPVRWPKK
jgi:hypothetical protein